MITLHYNEVPAYLFNRGKLLEIEDLLIQYYHVGLLFEV